MVGAANRCREIRLAKHPEGMIQAHDLTIVDASLPIPGARDLIVQNRWFRISISTRLMADPKAQAVEGIPFPVLKPGDTLADGAIGEVVACPTGGEFEVGDYVLHPFGWRDRAVVDVGRAVRLGRGPIEPSAYLGHGWTAYAALTRGIRIRSGDTAFVSSGAGAIGTMAGQIARRLGASRVIGSTSTQEKADWMKADLGYDAVILRGRGDFVEQLAAAAPDGLDVFVDMVGGDQLTAAAAIARDGARFVLLGALTAELDTRHASLEAPVKLDSFQLILKAVTLRGYSADRDHAEAFPEWLAWQRDAGLHPACTKICGLEKAPRALHDACEGRSKGLVMVEL